MTTQTPVPPPPRKPRRWPWIAATVAALLAGVGIGQAGSETPSASPNPTVTVTAEPIVETVEGEIPADEVTALEEHEAFLEEWEADLVEREAATQDAEEAKAANSVGNGIWTVGVDVEAGTYRATDVGGDCYWAIYATGSNGDDIVANDIPNGGNPTVTIDEGHDFYSQSCGEWVRS
jgi:hypothetical protein